MNRQKKIIILVAVIILIAVVAVILYFKRKKESFGRKGVTLDLSLSGLVRDVRRDLNKIGIKLKK